MASEVPAHADTTPAPTRAATIADVARAAGVATSTVSRALSNPQRVNAATRQRIERAAAELSYVPSAQAASLSSGKTKNIALLIPDISNPFFFDLIRGSQRQLRAAGYTQLLVDTEESEDLEGETLVRMRKSADGVILAAPRIDDAAVSTAAGLHPIVTVNRDIPGVPSVIIDTPSGVVQALTHLRSLGHRRIAYIGGNERSWSSRQRWDALRNAATDDIDLINIGPWQPTAAAGSAAADAAVTADVTACIAFNDLLAMGMMRRLAERGVRVPEDISIIGCDDIFGSDLCTPSLTTVTASIEEGGRVAVNMLLSQLSASSSPRMRTVIPTYLRIRNSSGDASGSRRSS